MAIPKKKPNSEGRASARPAFRVVGKDDAPPAAASGLNFGALAKPATTSKKTSDKPIIEPTGDLLGYLTQFAQHSPDFSRLKKLLGSKGSINGALKPLIAEAWFDRFAGTRPGDGSTMLATIDGKPIKLLVKEQYAKLCPDLPTLLNAVPEAEPHFKVVDTLKIEFDKIPLEKQQPLVDALLAAAEKLEITEGITPGRAVQPKPGFHAQRTTLFTPEVNTRINEIIPLTAYAQL